LLFFVSLLLSRLESAESSSRQGQEQATLEAAKKEGKVNVYMYRYGKVLDVFRNDYPEIRPFLLTVTGAQIITKVMAERRAGRNLADVVGLGSSNYRILHQQGKMLEPIQPALMLPEVIDESRWFGGKHRYLDPDNKYVFAYLANASYAQLYCNTNLINPKEFTSYYDLLKPKWNGKIVALDPRSKTEIGGTMQFLYYNPELGPAFIKQFFGNKAITFSRDSRQMIDWLGQGRFAICFGCSGALKAKNQGLPIEIFDTSPWKEGASFSVGAVRSHFRANHRIPTRQKFSSIGIFLVRAKWHCRNSAIRMSRPTPHARIFPKTRCFHNIDSLRAGVTSTVRGRNTKISKAHSRSQRRRWREDEVGTVDLGSGDVSFRGKAEKSFFGRISHGVYPESIRRVRDDSMKLSRAACRVFFFKIRAANRCLHTR